MAKQYKEMATILEILKREKVYPKFEIISEGTNEPECTIEGQKYLMFSSNNYLSLTQNKHVISACRNAVKKFGVGPGGSRVISGNISIIVELEKAIAKLTHTEDCVTYPTGYMANVGVVSAVMDSPLDDLLGSKSDEQTNPTIFSDEHNHGSIVDGCRLSKANKIVFKHNDFKDLTEKISQSNSKKKMIITEGVFSLEGEIIDLPRMVEVASGTDSLLMIDDAHGIGVIGENGGGVGEHYHLENKIDILMGCMDKAFGGTGGYLAGSKLLIDYLKISTRSSLLSSSLPTGMAGAMIESINQIKKGKNSRIELLEKAAYLKNSLINSGLTVLGDANIPSVPLFIGDERIGIEFERQLNDMRIYCKLVRWPAVPMGTSRFRIIVMTEHTYRQIDQLVVACKEIGQQLGIIKK